MYCFTEVVCLGNAHPIPCHTHAHKGQNKTKTGRFNNDNPKVGVGRAMMKTKEQESSGKKVETFYVVAEVRGQGNGRAHPGQREGRVIFP